MKHVFVMTLLINKLSQYCKYQKKKNQLNMFMTSYIKYDVI